MTYVETLMMCQRCGVYPLEHHAASPAASTAAATAVAWGYNNTPIDPVQMFTAGKYCRYCAYLDQVKQQQSNASNTQPVDKKSDSDDDGDMGFGLFD